MKEKIIHEHICRYLDFQYPDVIYTSDGSGIRLTIGQARAFKMIRCKRYKIPDLLILAPNNRYKGLIIEVKKDRSEVYTNSGEFRKNKHIEEQLKTLNALKELGYYAVFGMGFNATKKIIDNYFQNNF